MAFIKLAKTRTTENPDDLFVKNNFSHTKDNRWICHLSFSRGLAKFLKEDSTIPERISLSVDDQDPFLVLVEAAIETESSWSLMQKNRLYRVAFTWNGHTPSPLMQKTRMVKFDMAPSAGIIVAMSQPIIS